MPAKKKITRKPTVARTTTRPLVTSSNGPTYDTMMLVTILLLIFVYPAGLVLMWGWMKTWPVWLKMVISIPLLVSLLFVFLMIAVFGHAIREYRSERMNQYQHRYMMQITPLVSPSGMMQVSPTAMPSTQSSY